MASTGSSSAAATPEAASERVDLVIGLVSYDDAATIGGVMTAIGEGLALFADRTSRVVLADCGSGDTTVAKARANGLSSALIEVTPPRAGGDRLDLPYHGIPGKARALQIVLTTARDLDARACVVIDAAVASMSPQWLDWLVRPVLEHNFDFISPYYERHAFEGAITKGIVYPLVRALYGVRLRQPAAAEFACSRRLIDRFLDDDLWDREGAQIGIDLWLATSAASGDFRIGEAALGTRAHHSRGEEGLDLGATMAQVVGALLGDLQQRAARWQRTRGSVPVQQFGAPAGLSPAPRPSMDLERLVDSYRLGYRELRDIWTFVLPPRAIVELQKLLGRPPSEFRLDDELWARIVYDFAIGYRLRVLPRDHLLRSLVPLYLGWLVSFVAQIGGGGNDVVEQRIEALAMAFETQKPYLIARWRWPERMR